MTMSISILVEQGGESGLPRWVDLVRNNIYIGTKHYDVPIKI